MNLFRVVFHSILFIPPDAVDNLYKSFTSDAIKLSQENEFLALRLFRFTLSWRYIIVVSFIGIAFVVVKLKIKNSRNNHFWEVFGLLLPQYGPILPKYSREVVLQQTKTLFENFWRIWVFMEKERTQSYNFWSNSDPSFPPEGGQNRKK